MKSVRAPAVAGLFYPADEEELDRTVSGLLEDVRSGARERGPVPKAVIAPHAGYVYSGPVAASAYVRVAAGRGVITRVILLGPAHRVGFRGLAVSGSTGFATPLGTVEIDAESVAAALQLPQVRVLDRAHAGEHSLEVHLPFLQEVLDDFRVVPLVVGDAEPEDVAVVLDRLWGGEETLIVVSSDLSHYLSYDEARSMDERTARAIETLHPEDVGFHQACGRIPVNGLLLAARARGLAGRTVDLRNSGDTAGPRDRVVGYGAFVFQRDRE